MILLLLGDIFYNEIDYLSYTFIISIMYTLLGLNEKRLQKKTNLHNDTFRKIRSNNSKKFRSPAGRVVYLYITKTAQKKINVIKNFNRITTTIFTLYIFLLTLALFSWIQDSLPINEMINYVIAVSLILMCVLVLGIAYDEELYPPEVLEYLKTNNLIDS